MAKEDEIHELVIKKYPARATLHAFFDEPEDPLYTEAYNTWSRMIEDDRFVGCAFENPRNGHIIMLTPSVRDTDWQLSYFDEYRIPIMHENYGSDKSGIRNFSDLLVTLTAFSKENDVYVRARFKGE